MTEVLFVDCDYCQLSLSLIMCQGLVPVTQVKENQVIVKATHGCLHNSPPDSGMNAASCF